MRVCYVSSTFDATDGWGRYSRELARAARAAGIEPVVVTTKDADTNGLDLVAVHRILPPLPLRQIEAWLQLRAAPAVSRVAASCDLVHLLVEPYLPMVALATPSSHPLVMTAHGTWAVRPLTQRFTGWLHAREMRRLDLVVCQSAVTRDVMAAAGPLPAHVVLPGGVSPETLEIPGATVPGVPPDGHVVLTVGAVKRRKGHHLALAALARAAETMPGLHWVVAGDTLVDREWFDELRRRAAAGSGRMTVHWLGRVSEDVLRGCYQRASIFLLLPVDDQGAFEGLGLVVLEAAASGLPVVTCAGSGSAEAVRHLETGVVVAPGDAASAGDAVATLLANAGRRQQMGGAARAFARERSWTGLATALAARYQALVAHRQGRARAE